MAAVDLEVLHAQLETWAGAHYHEGVTVSDLRAMPGHAGLSFGFTVADSSGVLDRLVMRMPPKGVRRSGNTDVLRQVPLLQALRRGGVPVAELRWWDADEQWFEVPYFMVGLLPGTTFAVRDPDPSFAAAGASVRQRLRTGGQRPRRRARRRLDRRSRRVAGTDRARQRGDLLGSVARQSRRAGVDRDG